MRISDWSSDVCSSDLQEYAIKPGFAAVAEISPAVGEELFDTGVNMGPAIPALWFQQCLNALNDGGKHYPDIAEDGDIGPGTLAAFRAYRQARGKEIGRASGRERVCEYV